MQVDRHWEIFEAGETNQTKRPTSELHPMSWPNLGSDAENQKQYLVLQ